jgi:hypothetical protein
MSSEEEVVEIIPTLQVVVEDLSLLHSRAKKVLASERRVRRQEPDEMAELLQKLKGNLAKVRECLEEIEQVPSEEKKKGEEKVAKEKKRGRGGREEGANAVAMVEEEAGLRKRPARNDVMREEENDEEGEEEEEVAIIVKKARAKKLVDGGPCMVGEELVYFALPNKLDNKSFDCQLLSDNRTMVVERKLLEPVEFATLDEEVQSRYLDLLEADISRRFQVNAPMILKDHGKDMMAARSAVIEDPSQVDVWFDSLAKYAIASKQLSAANNTVLMLAASLHETLSKSKDQNWYATFKKQLAEFCKSCSMKVSTVERFLVAGSLMLRSPVLACMLPFFLVSNSVAIGMLLDDEEVVGRWEELFGLENGDLMEIEGREEEGEGKEEEEGVDEGEKEEEEEVEQVEEQASSSPVLEDEHQEKMELDKEQIPAASDDLGELHLAEEHMSNRQHVNDDAPDENLLHLIPGPQATLNVSEEKERSGEEEVYVPQKCKRCKQLVVFFLCDADEDGEHEFCWNCSGYDAAPADELFYPGSDVAIRSYLFCDDHIGDVESCKRTYQNYAKGKHRSLSLPSYVSFVQAEEARNLVRIFSSADCQFTLIPIQPDGWCMFACVSRAVGQTLSKMIDGLKGFVDAFVKSRSRRQSVFANKARFRLLWKKLNVEDDFTVQELWAGEDGDLLLPMIAEHLKNVQICIWNIIDGVLVKQPQVYGENREKTVNLLQINVIVPHYDLMELK